MNIKTVVYESEKQAAAIEIDRLRQLNQRCADIGSFKEMSTEDIMTISKQLKVAADALIMFPACECARHWALKQHFTLEDILRHRQKSLERP